jgi:hypothetical protein
MKYLIAIFIISAAIIIAIIVYAVLTAEEFDEDEHLHREEQDKHRI